MARFKGCRAPAEREIRDMSAFFLPKTHIDLLVSAAIEWKLWARLPHAGAPGLVAMAAEHAGAMGRMLWSENAASVRHRYDLSPDGEESVAYAELVAGYRWTRWVEANPAAAQVVMSVNGGNQTVPTLVFPDGSAATNPSIGQVKSRLG
jgi:mycoredoxin